MVQAWCVPIASRKLAETRDPWNSIFWPLFNNWLPVMRSSGKEIFWQIICGVTFDMKIRQFWLVLAINLTMHFDPRSDFNFWKLGPHFWFYIRLVFTIFLALFLVTISTKFDVIHHNFRLFHAVILTHANTVPNWLIYFSSQGEFLKYCYKTL